MADYPLLGFYFEVNIANVDREDAAFAEASGLTAERDVQEIVEGGENRYSHRLPTRAKHSNLMLKRGMIGRKTALFSWCKETIESDLGLAVQPRDIRVSLLDRNDGPMAVWQFRRAWPVKMDVSNFNAKESEIAVETLEFSYAFMTRDFVAASVGQGG